MIYLQLWIRRRRWCIFHILLHDAYSDEWPFMNLFNLKLIVNKFKLQWYRESVWFYMFDIIIRGIWTASLTVMLIVVIPNQTNQEKTLNFLFCELNNVYYFFLKVVRLIFYSLKVVFCLLTIQQTQLYILLIYFGNIPSINSVCSDQLNK